MKRSMTMPPLASALLATLLTGISAGLAAAPDAERRASLLNLLRQDCGSCHGITLQGGLGPALLPDNLAGKSDVLLVTTILEGRPGTPMPPWKHELSRDEARWLVKRLRQGVDNEQ
jgi:cytochrome c55X